jgi:hypothetical protein
MLQIGGASAVHMHKSQHETHTLQRDGVDVFDYQKVFGRRSPYQQAPLAHLLVGESGWKEKNIYPTIIELSAPVFALGNLVQAALIALCP